jgi:hypothetical protein
MAVSSQPGDDPSEDQDGPGEQAGAAGRSGQEEGASGDQASRGPAPGASATGDAASPDGTAADGSAGGPDAATGPEQDGDEPGPSDSPGDKDNGSAGEPPDPALAAEITGRIEQIQSAASAAAIVLAGDGNLRAALAGMDEIYDQAGQARRVLKAAAGGRKAPAARPGGLRDKVLAHLRNHPGASFTPHEIHKVLGNSSGAIANALDTLVKLGDAELATEKPRRFRLADGAAPAADQAPAEAGTGAGDTGPGDDTDLAGAA